MVDLRFIDQRQWYRNLLSIQKAFDIVKHNKVSYYTNCIHIQHSKVSPLMDLPEFKKDVNVVYNGYESKYLYQLAVCMAYHKDWFVVRICF